METVTIRTHGAYKTTVTAREHAVHADLLEKSGGTDEAPTPEELLLAALGSCMAQTAKLYAVRKGFDLQDVEIELAVERFTGSDYAGYDGDAAFVHEFQERVVLHGNLTDEEKGKIMEIVKKCPVRRIVTTPSFFVESLVESLNAENVEG
jgi:putative redox protein